MAVSSPIAVFISIRLQAQSLMNNPVQEDNKEIWRIKKKKFFCHVTLCNIYEQLIIVTLSCKKNFIVCKYYLGENDDIS